MLDQCVLEPWRAKAAELEEVAATATAACDAAQRDVDAVVMANEHTLMVIADRESRTADDQWQLKAECETEAHWNDKLRDAEAALSHQRAKRQELERQLATEEAEIAAMRREQLERAQQDHADAVALLAEATALAERTERELEKEHLVRAQRCGLLVAAREFPSDEDVQTWVIATLRALADALGRESESESESDASVDVTGVGHDDPLDPVAFLFRDESVRVVLEAMTRFSKTHRVQLQALRCLTALMEAAERLVSSEAEVVWPDTLAALLLRCDLLVPLQDALETYATDLETVRLGFALLRHVVTHAGGSSPAVRQFCQSQRSHPLSLRLLRLLDQSYTTTTESIALAVARLHAAHFLVVLATYNVTQPLLDAGVVAVALAQIDAIVVGPSTQCRDDTDVLTVRHFLTTLALLHALAPPSEQRRTGADRTRTLDASVEWTAFDAQAFVDRLHVFVSSRRRVRMTTRTSLDALCHWLVQLLRNLVWHHGVVAERLRSELSALENVALVADAVATVVTSTPGGGLAAGTNSSTVATALELVDTVWIRRYDGEGRLRPTPAAVLALLLSLMRESMRWAGVVCEDTLLGQLTRLMDVLSVVAANGASW